MGRAGQGADRSCNCLRIERSTRRGFLTIVSFLGLNLAALPALAQQASERPKEEDFLVAVDSDTPDALELKDIPVGGPPGAGVADGSRQQNRSQGFAPQ